MSNAFYPEIYDHHTRHYCQNCGSLWTTGELKPIHDFFERVAAGEPCPSGECPQCRALCQPVLSPDDDSEAIQILATLVEWEAQMGRFDATVWKQAKAFLTKYRDQQRR